MVHLYSHFHRYAPAYWLEMSQLEQSHSTTWKDMTKPGEWTVQQQDNHPFSSVAADQAIEQTLNRNCKTSGGLRGITQQR